MAEVEPNDDGIDRWVLFHYRYDPQRRQRRNVIVAAFDGGDEMVREAERRAQILRDLQRRGLADPNERLSGVVKPAGHAAEQRERRRLLADARRSLGMGRPRRSRVRKRRNPPERS